MRLRVVVPTLALLLTACAVDAPTVEQDAPSPTATGATTLQPGLDDGLLHDPPAAGPAQAAVAIADFDYAPDPVEVAVGATVTWTNQDSTAHTATIDGGGPTTGAIGGGASASLTFATPGTFTYVCQFHPGSMTGTVVVRPVRLEGVTADW